MSITPTVDSKMISQSSRLNCMLLRFMKKSAWKPLSLLIIVLVGITLSSCTANDNAHTTATTYIAPPPRQVLTVVFKPVPPPAKQQLFDPTADMKKPLLVFRLENGNTFRVGDEVPIDFTVVNAKLKGDGGEFRERYIDDDDDMNWLDKPEPFWLSGWIPGKHTIRVELIGPDGWPYRNGKANIVTREIIVAP
jgi:hypothetical protein